MEIGYEENFYKLMFSKSLNEYVIYFLILDGKVIYVGKTKDVLARLRAYKSNFVKGKSHNLELQKLYDSRDLERILFKIVDKAATRKDSCRLEKKYIDHHKDSCLNQSDDYFSFETRKMISESSKKRWKKKDMRNKLSEALSKSHVLISPDGLKTHFKNSRAVKDFLNKFNSCLHPNDRNRVGYQMLESVGENKGWKMIVDDKQPSSHQLCGILKTPEGKEIEFQGKSDLVKINQLHGFKLNINAILKSGRRNGYELFLKGQ